MKVHRFRFAPISVLVGLSVAALAAWSISHFSRLGFWPAFAIAAAAMLINGIAAVAEDNAPGGFNNPEPSDNAKSPLERSYTKRFAGFLLFAIGISLATWMSYSLFVEPQAATREHNPVSGIVLSVGSLFVGYKWTRGQQA